MKMSDLPENLIKIPVNGNAVGVFRTMSFVSLTKSDRLLNEMPNLKNVT